MKVLLLSRVCLHIEWNPYQNPNRAVVEGGVGERLAIDKSFSNLSMETEDYKNQNTLH